jgi:hypothetical protein
MDLKVKGNRSKARWIDGVHNFKKGANEQLESSCHGQGRMVENH